MIDHERLNNIDSKLFDLINDKMICPVCGEKLRKTSRGQGRWSYGLHYSCKNKDFQYWTLWCQSEHIVIGRKKHHLEWNIDMIRTAYDTVRGLYRLQVS